MSSVSSKDMGQVLDSLFQCSQHSTEDGSHSVQQVHLHIDGDYFCLFLPLWSLFAWMPVRTLLEVFDLCIFISFY